MLGIDLTRGLGARRSPERAILPTPLDPPPEGFAYVVNSEGAYVVDGDEAYAIVEIAQ